jgi:hypothetical protein
VVKANKQQGLNWSKRQEHANFGANSKHHTKMLGVNIDALYGMVDAGARELIGSIRSADANSNVEG